MPDLLDVYEGDPIMAPAFLAMIGWAIDQPDIRAAFEVETGAVLPAPPRNPLDKMIDDVTGVTDIYVMGFAKWAHDTMWADDDEGD